MKKKIFILVVVLTMLIGCNSKIEDNNSISSNNEMLSYTIDGEKTNEKPSKEEGYFVNKIICNNGSDMMWDNDNWEVELTDVKVKDRCVVDFTKDEKTQGYRVKVTSDNSTSLDSKSKATTLNGTVKIYPKVGYRITEISGCNGKIKDNVLVVKNITENTTCNIFTKSNILADIIKEAYPSKGERIDFSTVYTETGMHETTDYDGSTTYYFTGNPNNWVSYAGKMWRIIRINGDNSVRLLYAGTGEEDGYLTEVGKTKYNFNYNDPMYVGWKYGTSGSLESNRTNQINKSNAYIVVENWFDSLSNKDKEFINTNAIYCSDRNVNSEDYGISKKFDYLKFINFKNKNAPSLSCNTSDQFKDGFGLMSADEAVLAGGLVGADNKNVFYYLNVSGGSSTGENWWWTMTPAYYWWNENGQRWAGVFFIGMSGALGAYDVANLGGGVVRPVISLKSNVLVSEGDGTGANPYKLYM